MHIITDEQIKDQEPSKTEALARFLELDIDQVDESREGSNVFDVYDGREYLVLTEDESYLMVEEEILNSLWSFKASFLAEHIDYDNYSSVETAIEAMQEKHCEDCNEAIRKWMTDRQFQNLVQDAIQHDGVGHFLSKYDGEEHESLGYLIYRI